MSEFEKSSKQVRAKLGSVIVTFWFLLGLLDPLLFLFELVCNFFGAFPKTEGSSLRPQLHVTTLGVPKTRVYYFLDVPASIVYSESPCNLHCSVIFFRFLGFLLWFVLSPGGLREAPGGPGEAHG